MNRNWTKAVVLFSVVLFSLSVTQQPLFYSNQASKFLHGFAMANPGVLDEDWLIASTPDPLPVFSFLVYLTLKWSSPSLFYLQFVLLQAVYLGGLMGIGLFRFHATTADRLLILFAAITVLHSRGFQELTWLLVGKPFSSPFTTGVAQQFILTDFLQPATFGAFLLLSVALFLRGYWVPAVLALGLSAIFHPAYLLTAALLTMGYMLVSIRQGHGAKRVLFIGALAFAAVLPVVLYQLLVFPPSTETMYAQAMYRLMHERIPAHGLWSVWFQTPNTFLKLIVMCGGLLVAGPRIIRSLIVPVAGCLGLSLVQLVTDSAPLALLAPWRVSAFLVPVASVLLVASLTERLSLDRLKLVRVSCRFAVAAVVVSGAIFQLDHMTRPASAEEEVMDYVRTHASRGDVYLVPPVPSGFSAFRIVTGVPVVATRKTHPYRDRDLLEWFDRIERARRFLSHPWSTRTQELDDLVARFGVTHIVDYRSSEHGQPPENIEELYANDSYLVYRISALVD